MTKKVEATIALLILALFLISYVSATDVGYIYKKKYNVDQNFINIFKEMNLTVDLIDEAKLPKDLSKYRLIFVGDERFKNKIPVENYNSIITNYYFGKEWGLTDRDGISKLGSTSPLEVIKDGRIIQVYDIARFPNKQISIPYYFLDNENKAPGMMKVATPYMGDTYDFGDVISYADAGTRLLNGKTTKGKICFFGIVESDYWTEEGKDLFKDCLNFAGYKCLNDSNCPSQQIENNYCKNGSVYRDIENYHCVYPGTAKSECADNIIPELVKNCSFGCANGECLPECANDSQCSGGKVCINNSCVMVNRKQDSDCGTDGLLNKKFCKNNDVFDKNITYKCNNPKTLQSYCSNTTDDKLIKDCDFVCSNAECVAEVNDVALIDFPDSIKKIKLEYLNGSVIIPETPTLNCKEIIKAKVKVENKGNDNENVVINGSLNGDIILFEDVFVEVGNSSYSDSLQSIRLDLNEGVYDLKVSAFIPNDKNPSDNTAFRKIRISCPECTNDNECPVGKVCVNNKCVPVNCSSNLDCGSDRLLGQLFCKNGNVFDKYITYTCNNPGTANSYCSSLTTDKLSQECSFGCSLGSCLPECSKDSDCSNGKICVDNQCVPVSCKSNSDCGVDHFLNSKFCENRGSYDYFVTYTCKNPGTAQSYCSSSNDKKLLKNCDELCLSGECIECASDGDCGESGYIGSNYCSGNNLARNYKEYKCNNPGTLQSTCSSSTIKKIIEQCSSCLNNECVEIECNNNEGCNDNNLYTYDKCNNPATANSYCTHTVVNCVTDGDCGINGFYGNEFCSNNDVFKNYQESKCKNSATTNSYCEISVNSKLVNDCGDSYCNAYGNNYCKNGNVYHSKTCYNKGCSDNKCTSDSSTQEDLVQSCGYGCSNGICNSQPLTINCYSNSYCGSNGNLNQKFCKNGNVFDKYVTYTCNNPGTSNSYCSNAMSDVLVQTCNYGCSNGICNAPVNIICSSDSECNDNNLYTYDKCNNPGTANSYCTHTVVNCVTDGDCGIIGYYGSEFCSNNDVFKNYQESKCKNPGTTNSYCEALISSKLLNDCGNGYCDSYGNNFCENGNVFKSRTCYDKGCNNGYCYSNVNNQEQLVQTCSNGCTNGICNTPSIACYKNADCGADYAGNNYCSGNNVVKNFVSYICNNPGTANSYCSTNSGNVFVQKCDYICENGICKLPGCNSNADCNDNNPRTEDVCVYAGTANSYCKHNNIKCMNNAECGTNGYLNQKFCLSGNVYDKYITYTCSNPRLAISYCSNSTSNVLVQQCSNTCVNGVCC